MICRFVKVVFLTMVSVALCYIQLCNTFIERNIKFANGKTKICVPSFNHIADMLFVFVVLLVVKDFSSLLTNSSDLL